MLSDDLVRPVSRARPAIVIIDDDDAVRESTRMLLEACGYAVRDHASAESFLASDSGDIDLLLVDQHMPGMVGIDLLEMLHAKPQPTPALMVSGRSDHVIEARLARIGVKLLKKPVVDDQLLRLIEEVRRP
jgi:FixJ family two-component response regulator